MSATLSHPSGVFLAPVTAAGIRSGFPLASQTNYTKSCRYEQSLTTATAVPAAAAATTTTAVVVTASRGAVAWWWSLATR